MKVWIVLLFALLFFADVCYASDPPLGNQSATSADSQFNARLDALFGDHRPYRIFFERLQKAVAVGDKAVVASMVNYPIILAIKGKKIYICSTKDFISNYSRIFTPRLVTIVKDQRFGTLFARDRGVMIGSGDIWFSGLCDDFECRHESIKITAFNLESIN